MEAANFTAQKIIQKHFSQMISVLARVLLGCYMTHIAYKFVELKKKKTDCCFRMKLEYGPKLLKSGDTATVGMVPSKLFVLGPSLTILWIVFSV